MLRRCVRWCTIDVRPPSTRHGECGTEGVAAHRLRGGVAGGGVVQRGAAVGVGRVHVRAQRR
eukprot:241763-Pyramimonas_sp.AAC.1